MARDCGPGEWSGSFGGALHGLLSSPLGLDSALVAAATGAASFLRDSGLLWVRGFASMSLDVALWRRCLVYL